MTEFENSLGWPPQLFSNLVILHLSAYEDGTECSETSAYKIQMPGNYSGENIQHTEHSESLKSVSTVNMWCAHTKTPNNSTAITYLLTYSMEQSPS